MNTDLLECIKNYKYFNIKITNNKESTKLNNIVRKIYVINLYEDLHKRNYIYLLFKKYNIDYNLIVVDKIDKTIYDKLCKDKHISESELGCCLSHMWCLLDILKHGYENAIIFEDDVILSKHFVDEFILLYNANPKMDFLMLGAHDYNFSRQHYKNVNNSIYRPNKQSRQLFGAHANYYSKDGAKRMFYIRATNLSFFDNEYHLLFDTLPNSYICYPNLAISNTTESRINHEKTILSKSEIGYYSLCFVNINLNNYHLLYHNLLDISLLKKNDTVETFIERCLQHHIHDPEKVKLVKQRFSLTIFSLDELKTIIGHHNLIEPNSLSKKCIGEKS